MPLSADDISTIFERDAARMTGAVARQTFDAQVALDIVGEAFARGFEQRSRFSGDPKESGGAWINGIAANLVRDYFRSGAIERRAMDKMGIERQVATPTDVAQIEVLAGTVELRGRLAGALDQLSPENRRAVEMRVVEELEYDAVADLLGISSTAARARVSRGLRELRDLLEAQGIEYSNGALENV